MSEPTSITAGSLAGGIMVAGVATGLQAELVLPAFVGALWSLKALDPGSVGWRVVQVVVGTLAATWSTPLAAQFAAQTMPVTAGITSEMLRYPVALALGWGVLRFVLPKLEKLMQGGPS